MAAGSRWGTGTTASRSSRRSPSSTCWRTTSTWAPSAARSSRTSTSFAPAPRRCRRLGSASNKPSVNVLGTANVKGVPQLMLNAAAATPTPASALDGPPAFLTGNIAPLNYFGTGDGYRAVNTMQPPSSRAAISPAAGATDLRYADPAAATTLPRADPDDRRRPADRRVDRLGLVRDRLGRRHAGRRGAVHLDAHGDLRALGPARSARLPDAPPPVQLLRARSIRPPTPPRARAHLKDYTDLVDGHRQRHGCRPSPGTSRPAT